MKASPIPVSVALWVCLCAAPPAIAEYPFDPLMESDAVSAGSGSRFGPGPLFGGNEDSWDGGYDPYLYEDYGAPSDDLFAFNAAVWPGFISGNLQPGTDRSLYGGEWFQPLYQDGQTLWYFNFRGQSDDDSASEFNLGTGVRVLSDPGWIFGAYTYWDHLRSANGNTFNQGMLGVEAMDIFWDVRFNVYFPESGGKSVGAARARVSGGNLVVQTGLERAYWGLDFEVGNLLWAWGPTAQHEVRGFLGVYHFDHSANATQSITGPRARLEWRYFDLPYFGPGSRFTLGLTVQADRVRDGQAFAFARLRIPLDPWAHDRRRLSPLHRRMLDHVVRDVDVVTATANRRERAVNPFTGREIRGFARIDANTRHVDDLLANLEPDALIVVDGRRGDIELPHAFELKAGQTVIGGDTSITVRGASTRRRATFDPRGTRPLVDFGQAPYAADTQSGKYDDDRTGSGFQMSDHTQLIGVDIDRPHTGVVARQVSDVLLRDIEVTDFKGTGIDIDHSQNVLLENVRVRDAWTSNYSDSSGGTATGGWSAGGDEKPDPDKDPSGVGILVRSSSDVAIRDSLVEDTSAEGIRVGWSNDVLIEKTKIRDTKRDGIRVVESQNVTIRDVEIKDAGETPYFTWWDDQEYRALGGITLDETAGVTIEDSRIHGSKGVGVFGVSTASTRLQDLHIVDVEHGISFHNSQDLSVTGTEIILPDEPLRLASQQQQIPGLVAPSVGSFVPAHNGIFLNRLTGEVVVEDNDIRGGHAGAGIWFAADDGTTNLQVSGNVIEKLGSSSLLSVTSQSGHNLFGNINGNEVNSQSEALWLSLTGDGSRDVTVTDNQLGGQLFSRLDDAASDLSVIGNFLGGDPMGRIAVENGGSLDLQYRNNQSTPGAEVIRFENNGGQFEAAIEDNDHQPSLHGTVN